jgi:DNA repair exonuclease SbcCD nuclease subunit
LFPDEYGDLFKYSKLATWWGHFEFQGFVITGHSVKMPTGPDPKEFGGPKYIFSGHYHKRQKGHNIQYIGNTFPTNFGDAGDTERGMMIYNHESQQIDFYDWDECPQYIKTNVTTILDGGIVIPLYSRIKCLLDIPLTFEEHTILKNSLMDDYQLREFTFEDEIDITSLSSDDTDVDQLESVDELVIRMLDGIDVLSIDNTILIQQYKRL